ncbi:MAG: serine/threonine protein kinase [Chitinispirillaceae bacterium]|nr:serine/threonine protein kinase [Chitinispirillaceae bacterium]
MTNSELETSGLREKITQTNLPVLPDGSKEIQLGSGLITGILGEGGSAVIYEIKNKQLGLQRAVKLLKPNYTRDTYNRFLREFRISIQLSHPNLAVVHTIGQWNKLPFIEMEKITGFTLSEMVSQFGPLPTGLVTAIGIILCKSLEYLHSCTYEIDKKQFRGLLHLDLKPSNILLSDSGVLKIMDFGLSTPSEEVRNGNYPKAGVGSPQYIAPELLLGEAPPDVRSDIYSLGCILYELLSGVKTFPGPEEDAVMELRQTNTFVSLKKLTRTIPAELLKMIEECLSLKKDSRPLNFETIRRELESIHQSTTRLTPENTIQLYVTQRKANAPFVLPQPQPSVQQILRVAGIVLLVAGVLLVSGYYTLRYRSSGGTIAVHNDTTVAETAPSGTTSQKPVEQPQPAPRPKPHTDEGEFYAPALNSTQSALMDSVRLAWASRKFDIMLSLIDRLPPDLAQSKEVQLYKLRALGRGGEELGKLLDETRIPDGEYYFHRARYQFGDKRYKDALFNLDKALTLPCEFLDKRILGREVQLYKSRSLTAIFRADPTSENLKAALDAWNRLLELVSDKPNGIHSKEAQKEKQNLLAEAEWRGIS